MTSCCATSPEAGDGALPVGELTLEISRGAQRSFASRQHHRGALRVLRPHHLDDSGQVCYTVINPGGGYLGSDRYLIEVEVRAGASLLLTTQSATKVYRTPQGPAVQETTVRLGPDAVLEWLPDQLIVYREGTYRQRTLVQMHPTASLVTAEVVTPGWSPDGPGLDYEELRLRTEVQVVDGDGPPRPVVLDQLRLVPAEGRLRGLGHLEGASHCGQLLVVDARVDDELADAVADLAQGHAARVGVSRVGAPGPPGTPALGGLAVRSLGTSTEDLTALHLEVVALLRARWRGQGPVDLRRF